MQRFHTCLWGKQQLQKPINPTHQVKIKKLIWDYMERPITSPMTVTSPTWLRPPPYKQALTVPLHCVICINFLIYANRYQKIDVPVVHIIATFQPHGPTLLDPLAAHVTFRTNSKGMEDPVISHHVGRQFESFLCKYCTSILLLFYSCSFILTIGVWLIWAAQIC